jgi:hypothetical protein
VTAVVTAAPSEDDDEFLVERVACRCGRIADVVLAEWDGAVVTFVRCACGSFVPPAADGGSR